MKNIVKFILIIALLYIAFEVQKFNILSVLDINYYKATSDLNVRAGAGSKYAVLFTLKKGDEVKVLSKKGNWFQIQHQGNRGYSYSKYLENSITVNYIISRLSQQPLLYYLIGFITIPILFLGLRKFRKREIYHPPVYLPNSNRSPDILSQYRNQPIIDDHEGRGTRSERDMVQRLLNWGIPSQTIFHDLYLEKDTDHFSQIDLVVVTDVGIIVFEVKDYSGRIYGTGNQRQWTQVMAYGKQKYLFQNPIVQNQGHIAALRRKFNCTDNIPFYSIVVFYGDCDFTNVKFVPEKTFITKAERVFEVLNIIKKNNEPFQYSNKEEVISVLKEAEENGKDPKIQFRHSENIKGMLGTDRIFD